MQTPCAFVMVSFGFFGLGVDVGRSGSSFGFFGSGGDAGSSGSSFGFFGSGGDAGSSGSSFGFFGSGRDAGSSGSSFSFFGSGGDAGEVSRALRMCGHLQLQTRTRRGFRSFFFLDCSWSNFTVCLDRITGTFQRSFRKKSNQHSNIVCW